MSSERGIFLVLFFVMVLNGSDACFRSNEHEIFTTLTGESFYRECQCDTTGSYTNNLKWFDNKGEPISLRPGTEVYAEKQEEFVSIYIQNLTTTMSGTYKCVGKVDGVSYTKSYTVTAYEPLYFYDTPHDQYLINGRSSSIMCQPKSETIVNVSWQKEIGKEEYIDITKNEKYIIKDDSLFIHNVTDTDAGTYKCTARAVLTNEIVDEIISVEVMTEPKIIRVKATPDIYDPITVVRGMSLMIECIAEGSPYPEYFWNKTQNVNVSESNTINKSLHRETNTLIFDEIRPEDRGVYTCYAYNKVGTSAKNVSVEVLFAPVITDFNDTQAIEFTTVKIKCTAAGNSEPNISITYKDGDDYYDANVISINVDRSKKGEYVCNATNEVDSVQKSMTLDVLHKPYYHTENETILGWEGKSIDLNCEPDSNPPPNITWSKIQTEDGVEISKRPIIPLNGMPKPYFTMAMTIDNETAYGVYECIATNMFGTATKRISLEEGFRPGEIKDITLINVTATTSTFYLIGPDYDGGLEVLGFVATYDEEMKYEITNIHLNRTWAIGRPYILDKLKPNTTYWVRFAALNEVGPGIWSYFLNFTTLAKSNPDSPIWEEVPLILARNSHVLQWRPPNDNGEPIDYYFLTYCLEDDDQPCMSKVVPMLDQDATETELVDLKFNTTYLFQLIAHNAEGNSVAANISIFVPAPLLSESPTAMLSGGAVIGISIVIVLLCLLLLDVLLLVWRRQGIIATCCFKKDNKRKESAVNSRDKKGLLTNGESEERPAGSERNNGHKEFQYNKTTGVVTGKHSTV